jgi:Polysaccharide lyase
MSAKLEDHQAPEGARVRRRRRTALGAGLVAIAATLALLVVSETTRRSQPAPSWSGGFDTGNLRQYDAVQRAAPDRIAVVRSPRREGPFAVRLTAEDDDLVVSENPRAQLMTEAIHREGDEQFIGWSTYFPEDFPAMVGPDAFFVFFQFHGAPYGGSPPLGFGVGASGELQLLRSRTYDYDRVWAAPLTKGRWIDFVVHVKWSKDEDGFVELWLDGERQTFSVNGQQRLSMQTVEDDQDEGLKTIPTNYRRRGIAPQPVTIYHDEVKVGDSYAMVAPQGDPSG